ncbi:MAG: hypothetical protein HOQ05_12125 [Corynebacteriales bacterium]|nr:hypothetical protein [Mycobacteriales bacterium]
MEQATVHTFAEGSGSVVFDNGVGADFDADAFARSGLRFLRPGQRVRLQRDSSGRISEITLLTYSPDSVRDSQ